MPNIDEDAVLAKRDPRLTRNLRRENRRAAADALDDGSADAEKERLAKVKYDTTEHKLTFDELEAVMRKPIRDYEKTTPQTEYGTGLPNYSFQRDLKGDMAGRVVIPWAQRKIATYNFDEDHLNQLSKVGEEHWIVAFIKELTGFFALLLWGGSLLCFIGFGLRQDYDNLYLGIVLAVVVIVTGVFSFSQNAQSANLMAQFSKLMANNVRVATDRAPHSVQDVVDNPNLSDQTDGDGRVNVQTEEQFDTRYLIRGDVIYLKTGNKVPADVRLLWSNDFKVNNAPLTGESDMLTRKADMEKRDDAKEAINMAFFGTDVAEGDAVGVVLYTGDDTFIGKIALLTQQTDEKQTPINREIHHFIGIVSAVAIFLGVTFFIIGAALGTDIISNLVFMIGIIVANVPEGLLATVTVSLALTSQAMAEKQVLVKNMEGVETLGSTTAICSDKTGTLTQNRMTIAEIVMNNELYTSPFVQEAGSTQKAFDPSDASWPFFREALTMNTAAVFKAKSVARIPGLEVAKNPFYQKASEAAVPQILWDVDGDASETAMIKMALYTHASLYEANMPTDVGDICSKFSEDRIAKDRTTKTAKVAEIPFKSKNKYHVVVVQNVPGKPGSDGEDTPYTVYMKGAQEKIVERCSHMVKDGEVVEISEEQRKKLRVTVNGLMAKGRRLLGFAKYDMTRQDCEDAGLDYEFAGMSPNGEAIATGNAAPKSSSDGKGEKKGKNAVPGMFSPTIRNFPMGERAVDEDMERPEAPGADASEEDQAKYAMAVKQFEGHHKLVTKKLVFIGITALIDPPRPAVPDAVLQCQSAGIRVVMVTGDHPKTAAAIARMVNIFSSSTFRIGDMKQTLETRDEEGNVTSVSYDPCVEQPNDHDELVDVGPTRAIAVPGWSFEADTPDSKWDYIFDHDEIVFARTSPDQKLQIVERFQNDENEVVAVTGDGVNDAPALKTANIGVAMGIAGTEVTKGAADMILIDDNFASIVRGVESGRLIFDNLKKSIAYTLSSNIPEITPFLIFITVQTPLPLSTVLILCIDLGTDMVPAISMAWENKEADIMRRPARDSDVDRLVTRKLISFAYLQIGVIQATAGFFTWVVVLNDYGYPPEILPGLGAFDNWGKQTLWCRVTGGRMRDISGATYEGSQDYYTGIEAGFPLWDAGLSGAVEECTFPARNIRIDRDPGSGWDVEDASTYGEATADQFVFSRESTQALQDAGFIPYIPYQAFVSPFWNNDWLAWDQREGFQGDVPGSGSDPTPIIFFSNQLPGWFTINDGAGAFGNEARGSEKALDLLRLSSVGTANQFGFATFNQPAAGECDTLMGVCRDDDGSILVNVASRMSQKEALHHAQCAFFVSIVVVQWADLLICKTRWLSIYHQGMVNPAMNFGIIFETLLAALLCYVPGIGNGLGTRPLRALHWVPAVPFSLAIFLYDEIRKYLMRVTTEQQVRNKQIVQIYGWLARNTYY